MISIHFLADATPLDHYPNNRLFIIDLIYSFIDRENDFGLFLLFTSIFYFNKPGENKNNGPESLSACTFFLVQNHFSC